MDEPNIERVLARYPRFGEHRGPSGAAMLHRSGRMSPLSSMDEPDG